MTLKEMLLKYKALQDATEIEIKFFDKISDIRFINLKTNLRTAIIEELRKNSRITLPLIVDDYVVVWNNDFHFYSKEEITL